MTSPTRSRFGDARMLRTMETVTLPDDGKVSGAFTMHYTDANHAAAYTDGAHVNDDNLAINFRGESFLVRIDVYRLPDGSLTIDPPSGGYNRASVTRRQNWSDAPPSFAAAIVSVVGEAAMDSWDQSLADAAQERQDGWDLERLRKEADELAGKLREARAAIRKIERRYV